jgi:hypothetical protein
MSQHYLGPHIHLHVQIRDVGTVFLGGDFERSLQELTLDGNLLVDVSGG